MKPIIPFEPVRKDDIPPGDDWIAQVKWDGVRILTYFDGTHVRLFNRKKNERTNNYPELTAPQSYCHAESVILDGEVIALEEGKPSFHEVMRRDGIRRIDKVQHMKQIVPVFYMIFDVLFVNGEWIHDHPLNIRQKVLTDIIQPTEHVQLVSTHDDAETLFQVMEQQDMEGIVMKKPDAPYLIGGKKEYWVKVKNYKDVIAVIGGFTLNDGVINAVLLGLYDRKGQLIYIGHTGTGKLKKEEWRKLTEILKPMTVKHRPFVNQPERNHDAFWVEPKLTVKVQYLKWTSGKTLRQPSIQGFVNVPAAECMFEKENQRR